MSLEAVGLRLGASVSFLAAGIYVVVTVGLALVIAGLVWLDRPQPKRDNHIHTRKPR